MTDRAQVLTIAPLLTGHYRWTVARPGTTLAADPHAHTVIRDGRKHLARPAGSDDWHVLLTLRGRGLIGTTTPRVAAPPRRIVLWRPGVPQCYAVAPGATGWERMWVHVHPPAGWFDLLAWPEVEAGLMAVDLSVDGCRAVRSALAGCIAHDHSREPDRLRLAMNSLELALLLVAREVVRLRPRLDQRIERMIAQVGAELAADWSLAAMASAAGVSIAQLVRLCARHLGESPHRMLERLRLDESCRRLERDRAPVARIAAAVGFSDVSHFTRRFRARFTVTPALWRSGQRNGELIVTPDPEHRPR